MDEQKDDKLDSLEIALRALAAVFVEKLPAKLLEMETALNQLAQNKDDPDTLNLLYRLLHTMAGSAGTFGFDQMGLEARALEARLKPLLAGGAWSDAEFTQFSSDVSSYLAASSRNAKDKAP